MKNKCHSNSIEGLPIEVFPEPLRNYILELSKKKNIPKDFSSVSFLTAFSTAIGKKAVIFHDNYSNYAGVWTAVVGASGTNKSEPISIALKPLRIRDEQKFLVYEDNRSEFEEYLALSKKEKTLRDKLYPPMLGADIVDDITFETLYDALNENPKGILSANDELMSWISDLGGYAGKSSQSKFLSLWSNETTTYLRKEQKLFIKKPFVNIIGGIQPALLRELGKKNRNSDGTINRFLFAYPQNVKAQLSSGEKISEFLQAEYHTAVNKLADFAWTEQNSAKLYILGEVAQLVFEDKLQQLNAKLNTLPEESIHRAFLAKLKIYLYKLTLLLHLIEFAYSKNEILQNAIQQKTVCNACLLIDYFEYTAHKVQLKMTDDQNVISEKQILVGIRDRTQRPYSEILDFMGSNVKENTFRQWVFKK